MRASLPRVSPVWAVCLVILIALATPQTLANESSSQMAERLLILRREMLSIATDSVCIFSWSCVSAPAGTKACGGPSFWLPYSSLIQTENERKLLALVREYTELESRWNKAADIMSNCMLESPPDLVCSGWKCAAKPYR